jgi:hypothetical protein
MKLIRSILIILALGINAQAASTSYYQTDFTTDVLVGNDAIDFSSRPEQSMLVWLPSFNLSGYDFCFRTATYTIDYDRAMSLTCTRTMKEDHVSRTINVRCSGNRETSEIDQMDLIGDDSANHVLFTIKCRTKLIQQPHKS